VLPVIWFARPLPKPLMAIVPSSTSLWTLAPNVYVMGADRVDAFVGLLDHLVVLGLDEIRVVPVVSDHDVRAGATVQHVIGGIAVSRLRRPLPEPLMGKDPSSLRFSTKIGRV
jgi:hypothetical protein